MAKRNQLNIRLNDLTDVLMEALKENHDSRTEIVVRAIDMYAKETLGIEKYNEVLKAVYGIE